MRRLAILSLAVLAADAPAAGPPEFPRLRALFGMKKKDDPAPSKAKQLLETLKSDTDEKKRKAAAEELADFDPRGNADIMAGLIASLRQDPAVAVREAAADTIGKLKPVSAQAGVALEETVQSDPADGVRKAAQGALFQYHLNGYKASPTAPVQSDEPPLAKAKGKNQVVAAKTPIPAVKPPTPALVPVTVGRNSTFPAETAEPPLAKPKTAATPPLPGAEPTVVPPAANAPGLLTVPTVTPPPMPNVVPDLPAIPTPGKPKG
jgi:hypothetical protein